MNDIDIHNILERWGAWAASYNNGVDWSPVAAGFKGLLPYRRKPRPQCTDEEGMVVDGCVAKLKIYRPDEYELLVLHFVFGISLRKLAKWKKCSDGSVRKNLEIAKGFIMGSYVLFYSVF
ncbi:antiterminator Q family protein [Arsenophonus nasoniae]|uniref:Antiterminator Q family protein n=1 Tax=Arsenophonus nasoniae TaxID=638 RepID=A0AA95GH75_9GAMM|nr:antiterminator Q family protein [Arsenophonus nasoniae]WGL96278.1 antiterminator Q family protein [Arsenophonus nasoniae]